MKKSLLALLFALAALASQAWGGDFCNCGTCVGSTPDGYGCEDGGCYYKSGQDGGVCNQYCPEVDVCPAGTLPPKIVEEGGYPTGKKEWCRWETSCWPIVNNGRDDCVKDGYVYWDVPKSGEGANKQCEGGTWSGEGKGNPNEAGSRGYCEWGPCVDVPNNPYGCEPGGGCFEIMDDQQSADCPLKRANKSQCSNASLPAADRNSPIVSIPKAQGLTVVPNGRSLHILSARDAHVSLYNLAGNRVFNSSVSKGNSTVSLANQKQGVYYAVVASGAQTQIVKVLLK